MRTTNNAKQIAIILAAAMLVASVAHADTATAMKDCLACDSVMNLDLLIEAVVADDHVGSTKLLKEGCIRVAEGFEVRVLRHGFTYDGRAMIKFRVTTERASVILYAIRGQFVY